MYSWSWEAKESHSLIQSSAATVCIKKRTCTEPLGKLVDRPLAEDLSGLETSCKRYSRLSKSEKKLERTNNCNKMPIWSCSSMNAMSLEKNHYVLTWMSENQRLKQLTAPPRHPMTKTIAFPATPTRSVNIPKPTTSTQPLWSLETVRREHARIIMTFLECLDTGQLKCPHFGSSGLQWAHWSECGTLWPERAHVYSHVAHVCSCLLLLILIDISSTGNRQCHA